MKVPLIMPDLELGEIPVLTSSWLVPLGNEVTTGDRILELSAGEVSIDLSAPACGRLIEKCVSQGQQLHRDQTLGLIETLEDEPQ